MKVLREHYFNTQFLRFLAAGGGAAIINFCSRIALNYFMSYSLSIIFAYFIGMASGYLLFKLFVFEESTNKTKTEISWYILINGIGLIQILAVSLFLANYVFTFIHNQELRESVAHGIGLCSTVVVSFIGHKLLTFKQ